MVPSPEQAFAMEKISDVRRWIWNRCVDTTEHYLLTCEAYGTKPEWGLLFGPRPKPGKEAKLVNRPTKTLSHWLKIWRNNFSFTVGMDAAGEPIRVPVNSIGSYAAQQEAVVAFTNAWRRCLQDKNVKRPKFKSRYQSVQFRDVKKEGIGIRGASVKVPTLPAAIRYVPIVKHREIIGTPLSLSFSRRAGRWFVAITCELEMEAKVAETDNPLGIDLGVAKTATCSDGRVFVTHESIARLKEKLAHHQARLASMTKGSRNYQKRKQTIAKLHWQIANCRENRCHEISRAVTASSSQIIVEDLNIKGMTKSAKGTVEEPGKNVAAKSALNREILNQGWGNMVDQIQYKVEEYGGSLTKVDPAYTSQKCSACGCVAKESRKSQSIFECVSCGHSENADVNASKNIRDRGCDARSEPEMVK